MVVNILGDIMAKRFTDTNKWRNEWFRTLPLKAKLSWIYICDECESHGLMKMDYGLATFQLGFTITKEIITDWFKDKIYHLDDEKFIIVQFFEFQYGTSKDTWSAKIEARKKLELLGFTIQNNKLLINKENDNTTVPPQWDESDTTPLIRVRGRGRGRGNNIKEDEILKIYETYPRKEGKRKGVDKLKSQLQTPEDLESFKKAVLNYSSHCLNRNIELQYIKQFSTFVSCWEDWINPPQDFKNDLLNPNTLPDV